MVPEYRLGTMMIAMERATTKKTSEDVLESEGTETQVPLDLDLRMAILIEAEASAWIHLGAIDIL